MLMKLTASRFEIRWREVERKIESHLLEANTKHTSDKKPDSLIDQCTTHLCLRYVYKFENQS